MAFSAGIGPGISGTLDASGVCSHPASQERRAERLASQAKKILKGVDTSALVSSDRKYIIAAEEWFERVRWQKSR